MATTPAIALPFVATQFTAQIRPRLPATSSSPPAVAVRPEKAGLFPKGCSSGRRRLFVKASVSHIEESLALKNKAVDMAQALKGASIFLVGMHCVMKTNVGKALADALKYYYFDSDILVVQAAGGESAAKAYKEGDEEGFRNSETEVLKQLSSMGRLVVCTGNGAVQSSTNLAYLRYGISVWVDVPLKIVAKDAMESPGPHPLLCEISASDTSSEVFNKLVEKYRDVRDGYATADATISVQNVAAQLGLDEPEALSPETMALEVFNQIEKLTRVKKMMEEAARPF